jgi:tetratricopeptide (TPR) repeat protein
LGDRESLLSTALAAHQAGQLEQALALYRQLLQNAPQDAEALNFCGVALMQRGDLIGALSHLQGAVLHDPESAGAQNNLGNALRAAEDFEGAKQAYQRAVALDPTDAHPLHNLAKVLSSLGALGEAEAALRAALVLAPNLCEAYRQLAELRPAALDESELARLEQQITSDSIGPDEAVQLSFALGRCYEARGDFARAFVHFERGNRLKRASFAYDIAADEAWVERIITLFDRRFMARPAHLGDPSDAPILIVGMPRAGSTLVEQILASHSAVHGGGELPDFARLVPGLLGGSESELPYPESIRDLDAEALVQLGTDYVAALRARAPASPRVTDKMPSNLFCLGLMHMILPEVRIVHCRRDPRDTCLACYTTLFSSGQQFAYDADELARYHALSDRMLRHWQSVMPGRIHEVRYEALVDDVEGETRKLVAFLGLPFEEACLRFHDCARPVSTASAAQVRKPIYRTAVGRAKRYGSALRALDEALARTGLGNGAKI